MAYRYKCATCHQWHEGFPDIGYDRPDYAHEIPEAERSERLSLTSDLCVVDDVHYFIRCVLPLPISGIEEEFGFGVWSSLSESNFLKYQDHYDEDMSDWEPMFGYLSNRLPGYPDTINLHLSVKPQAVGQRPLVTVEAPDHPLTAEQRDGIALDKVLKLIDPLLHG